MTQKKPQAGEWWMSNDGSEGPVYIVGKTDAGNIVFQAYKDCTPIVDYSGWDHYHHEPDCTGFEWQPETFPQWYEPLMDACAAYGIRTSKTELIVVHHDGKRIVREWETVDEVRKQITQAEAEARVKKPEPVESPDDWVTQDRVHVRRGFDYTRWVDKCGTPTGPWIRSQESELHRHHGDSGGTDFTIEVRCRRRDLPPLPQETPQREYIRLWLQWGNCRVYGSPTMSDDPKDREIKHDGTGFYLEDGK